MSKEGVEAAIAALEASGRTIDKWVLIFAAGVAICLTVEMVFSVAHWVNEQKLRPLRIIQAQLHESEVAKLNNDTARLRDVLRDGILANRAIITTTEVMALAQGL